MCSSCFYVGDSHHIATSLTSISNERFIFVIILSPLSIRTVVIQFPICLSSLLMYLSDLHWLYLVSCLEILPIIILFYNLRVHLLFSPEQVYFLTLRKFNFGMFNNNINSCLKIIYFRMVVVEGVKILSLTQFFFRVASSLGYQSFSRQTVYVLVVRSTSLLQIWSRIRSWGCVHLGNHQF